MNATHLSIVIGPRTLSCAGRRNVASAGTKREADQNGSLSAGATKYVWFFIITTSVNCKGIERNRMTTLNLLYSYLELGPYIHE